MLQTIEGIYENGRVELLETPADEVRRARVIVTFLTAENETVSATDSNKDGEKESFKTVFDVAPHLVGSVSSDISDLSTNKKYIEGFGREKKRNR